MKRFLIIFLVLINSICFGQAKIGMSHSFHIAPNDTVSYGDSVNLFVYVKNTGNAAFTGSVLVQAQRDTTGGTSCNSSSVVLSAFLPGDSLLTTISFTPTPGTFAFKSGGNGNTIVVWPFVSSGSALPGDSVRPVVWINDATGILEFDSHPFKIFPNPTTQYINMVSQQQDKYKKILIYDVFARKVKEVPFKETIDVSELNSGSYWMIINSEDKSYRVNFIKE